MKTNNTYMYTKTYNCVKYSVAFANNSLNEHENMLHLLLILLKLFIILKMGDLYIMFERAWGHRKTKSHLVAAKGMRKVRKSCKSRLLIHPRSILNSTANSETLLTSKATKLNSDSNAAWS